MFNKNISTPVAILILVVITALAGGVFYWQYLPLKNIKTPQVTLTKPSKQTATTKSIDTLDWKTYINRNYKFSFRYPKNFQVFSTSYSKDDPLNATSISVYNYSGNYSDFSEEKKQMLKEQARQMSIEIKNIDDYAVDFEDYLKKVVKELNQERMSNYKRQTFAGKEAVRFKITKNYKTPTEDFAVKWGPAEFTIVNLGNSRIMRIVNPSGESDFGKILSTFEFIEENQVASIEVTSPKDGREWRQLQAHEIKWNSQGVEKVDIILERKIITDFSASKGSLSWIPTPMETRNKIKVVDSSNSNVYDKSGWLSIPKREEYNLAYAAGPGGSIDGKTSQTVLHGEDGAEVIAQSDEDYDFDKWSDGVTTTSRVAEDVTEDLSVTAQFNFKKIDDGVYRNEEYGFMLEYPQEWDLRTAEKEDLICEAPTQYQNLTDDVVILQCGAPFCEIKISVYSKPQEFPLSEFYKNRFPNYELLKTEKVSVGKNNRSGTEFAFKHKKVVTPCCKAIVAVEKGEHVIEIEDTHGGTLALDESFYKGRLGSMLSTFEFID